MTDLSSLLNDLNIETRDACPAGLNVSTVTDDSRRAGPESLFVAIPGAKFDGHNFLADVAVRGCRAALVERKPFGAPPGLAQLRDENDRRAQAHTAQRLAGDPTHDIKLDG
jgi:UDP-N-acetylmuramoyl-L-alanyl-D-glutamate--2,6-diaminopimelate ligase